MTFYDDREQGICCLFCKKELVKKQMYEHLAKCWKVAPLKRQRLALTLYHRWLLSKKIMPQKPKNFYS